MRAIPPLANRVKHETNSHCNDLFKAGLMWGKTLYVSACSWIKTVISSHLCDLPRQVCIFLIQRMQVKCYEITQSILWMKFSYKVKWNPSLSTILYLSPAVITWPDNVLCNLQNYNQTRENHDCFNVLRGPRLSLNLQKIWETSRLPG